MGIVLPGTGSTVWTAADADGGGDVQGVRPSKPIIKTPWQTPTITAGAYTAGMAVGGLITFTNAVRAAGLSGRVKNYLLIDDDKQDKNYALLLFDSPPTAPVDHTAYDPSLVDLEKACAVYYLHGGVLTLANRSVIGDTNNSFGQDTVPYVCVSTSLYGVLVADSNPTFTGTTHLHLMLMLELD
jgi:hypothetical protein